MASAIPTNNTSFKKMIERFFDKQLVNEDQENELIILGKSYNSSIIEDDDVKEAEEGEETKSQQSSKIIPSWPIEFLNDVGSRIWLTYRTGFPAIPKSADGPSHITMSIGTFLRSGTLNDFKTGFTTDAGWGCMIRTSQSLLANALIILKLGRDWRYIEGDKCHDSIVSWFIDVPSAPFSIHNFVIEGFKTGKKAGEWFGPTAASRSIHNICNEKFNDCGLRVYLSEDGGDIYEDDFFKIAKGEGDTFQPMLILSALRLGVENVNPIYWDSLKKTLSIPQSVGIAGGREKSSHYFFGLQGDYLFYFDPHLPQESLQLNYKEDEFVDIETKFNFKTVHTTKLRKIHLTEMDPSMLIGFLIKTEEEYYNWKKIMQEECKLILFSNKKQQQQQQLRKPSIVEFDDEGFVDLGFNDDNDDDDDEITEPIIMVEERRFSEPVMVDKDDLSANATNTSQVFENLSS